MKDSRYDWGFQELLVHWNVWSFGVRVVDRRGWELDEKHVYLGPWEWIFLSSKQMEDVTEFVESIPTDPHSLVGPKPTLAR